MNYAKLAEIAGFKTELHYEVVYAQMNDKATNRAQEKWMVWQPDKNIDQAMMVLQAWLNKSKYNSYDMYYANYSQEHTISLEVTSGDCETVGMGCNKLVAEAICKAVLEAVG